jgi:hypothetical protein
VPYTSYGGVNKYGLKVYGKVTTPKFMDIFVPYGVKTTLALSPEKFTLCITIEVIIN